MNILLTGGSGMVGQNIIHSNHFKDCNLYSPSSEELDLLNKDSINQFLKKKKLILSSMRQDLLVVSKLT